jgi:lysophospholipase L1-like esterase
MPALGVFVGMRSLSSPPVPADLVVFIGDSNARGTQADPQSVSYSANPLTFAWNGSAWAQYVPNVNAGYTPAAGLTGLHFGSPNGNWGPELRFAQRYSAGNPGRALFVLKYAASGSFAMYNAAATSNNTFLAWDTASGGALMGVAKTELDEAVAAMQAMGYAPTLRLVNINLGANDASNAATAAGFQAALSAMLTTMRSTWGVVAGVTRFVLNRVPTAGAGIHVGAVRTATMVVADAAADVFWADLDASANNGGSDAIHFNAAGQIANGNAVFAEYISPENTLKMTLGTDGLAWWDAGWGVSLSGPSVTSWRDRIAGLAPAQATAGAQPTWAAADFNSGPSVTCDGVNDTLALTSGFGPLPTGATPCWIWAVVEQSALVADTGSRTVVSWGGNVGPPSTERRLRRTVVSGVNRAQMLVGTGAGASATINDTAIDLSGRRLILAKIGATSTTISVDAGAVSTSSAVPATGTTLTQMTLGSGPATQFWSGKIRDVLITRPLSTDKEAAVRAFLSAR